MRTRFTVLCLPHSTALTHHPVATVASVYRQTVFSASIVLVLIFPTPGPSTVAASHSGNSMFAVDAATSVITPLICNCETEVVPLQTSHSMPSPPPPPPSFAPARLRWCPFNIYMQRCHHRHHHHPCTRQKGGGGPPTFAFDFATSIRSHVSGTDTL
jgi:hypothetical protein